MGTFNFIKGDGASALYDADGTGVSGDPFKAKSPALLGDLTSTAATSPSTASANLNALLRGLWAEIISRLPNPTYGGPTLTVTSTLSTGIFFDISKFKRLRIQIANTGSVALTGFEISTRSHASGDMQIHLNAASHFTSPSAGGILKHCADLNGAAIDLTTLPSGGKAILALDLRDFFAESIRIRATAGGAGTNLQFYWGGAA